ncbi:oxygenase MpaB family protein [Pedobacter sp. P351]|uniref:oxygenase MpaB family protein n=1 Tax=Pedobacter superstes TaxID=3133441 RepID=UPI0030B1BD6F
MSNSQQFSDSFLSEKRLKGDPAAEIFIRHCFSNADSRLFFYTWLKQLDQNSGLNQLPADYRQISFIQNCMVLPAWADEKLMRKGSSFFIRHAEKVMQLLGLLSLPYCYAAADGAMVLYLSQKLTNDAGKRLSDTADFIWNVMAPDAFHEDGKGFANILKIRLTHALARYYTLESGQWNNDLGFPVNQEDMAGTNLSFSLIVVRGLRKLGLSISYEDQLSFLHLWNVIGFLLGLDEDLIPQSGKSANVLESAIRERHFKPSLQGRELTKALTTYFNSVTPEKVSAKDTLQLMRYLLEDKVSDILDLPPSSDVLYLPYFLKIISNLPDFSFGTSAKTLYQQKYQSFKKQSSTS